MMLAKSKGTRWNGAICSNTKTLILDEIKSNGATVSHTEIRNSSVAIDGKCLYNLPVHRILIYTKDALTMCL